MSPDDAAYLNSVQHSEASAVGIAEVCIPGRLGLECIHHGSIVPIVGGSYQQEENPPVEGNQSRK
jgi:hypothetical protein